MNEKVIQIIYDNMNWNVNNTVELPDLLKHFVNKSINQSQIRNKSFISFSNDTVPKILQESMNKHKLATRHKVFDKLNLKYKSFNNRSYL